MFWTHIYDLIFKLITLIGTIVIMDKLTSIENNPKILIILSIIIAFILYKYIIRTLATYLYCKLTLKMNLNLSQAKQLNDAFSPVISRDLKWFPMTELRNMDSDNKFQIALNHYNQYRETLKQDKVQQIKDFNNAEQKTKILTVLKYGLYAYFAVAVVFNLPPSNFITQLFCVVFNTENYYPILNILILLLATNLIFKSLDKNVK